MAVMPGSGRRMFLGNPVGLTPVKFLVMVKTGFVPCGALRCGGKARDQFFFGSGRQKGAEDIPTPAGRVAVKAQNLSLIHI